MNNFEERFVLEKNTNNINNNIIYDEHLLRYEVAAKYVSEKNVLDIASGSGYGSYFLAKKGAKSVIGVDIDNEAIIKASNQYKINNLTYRHGSALNIPVDDNSIEVAISFETIEHLKNEKEAEIFLAEIRKVLKENGLLIISTPNKEVFKEKNPYHFKEYTKDEFGKMIKKYFKNCLFLEQYNAISSVIHNPKDEKEKACFYQFDKSVKTALYFVAICSNSEISKDIFNNNFVANNETALNKLKNNPILKLSDKIYPFYRKIFKK